MYIVHANNNCVPYATCYLIVSIRFFFFFQTVAKDHAPTSGEFFRLLARLLNHTHQMQIPIQGVNKLLELELKWLLNVRVSDVHLVYKYGYEAAYV